jgi:hypothetical protein
MGKEAIGDVIVVDLDKGEVRPVGNAFVKDFVGESGSVLKQASDSLAKASRMANMFFRGSSSSSGPSGSADGSGSGSGASSDEQRERGDVVGAVISELKSCLSGRPGSSSVAGLTSELLRSFPGGSKTSLEESQVVWALEAEKTVRDAVMAFFVYLFADLEDYVPSGGQDGFDNSLFMSKRYRVSLRVFIHCSNATLLISLPTPSTLLIANNNDNNLTTGLRWATLALC